jgi:hypothetical protein
MPPPASFDKHTPSISLQQRTWYAAVATPHLVALRILSLHSSGGLGTWPRWARASCAKHAAVASSASSTRRIVAGAGLRCSIFIYVFPIFFIFMI